MTFARVTGTVRGAALTYAVMQVQLGEHRVTDLSGSGVKRCHTNHII